MTAAHASFGSMWVTVEKKLGYIYFFSFQMAVRFRYEHFPCVRQYTLCAFLYRKTSVCMCVILYSGVLWLADDEASEHMWHLNGLLFGKQVAECDRS